MSKTYLEVLPDPKRVIEGLRDTGYQIETAIEDIIDNSIAAEATKIDVRLEMDHEGNIEVFIADNGYGMNKSDLINAMRYGSRVHPSPTSLGKFGLGLKTASTAFCRELSVISKDKKTEKPVKASWDLDHVARVGKWELALSSPTTDELERLRSVAGDSSGTLVIWRKVDRLIKTYSDPGGIHARRALEKVVEGLIEHSSMVYQRFLDHTDTRAPNIEISINGRKIESYNPFVPEESDCVAEENVTVEINGGKEAVITVRAFILPTKWDFSSPEAYSKSRYSNQNQGIYVYRENRLIYGPGWLKMFAQEPHFTSLRVEFSFDHRLDDAFHIDIKKSQIILNEDLHKWLKEEFLPPLRREAEQRYRRGKKKEAGDTSKNLHDGSNVSIHEKIDDVSESSVTSVDPDRGEAVVTGRHGSSRIKISIRPAQKPGQVHVQPVQSIQDGLLWEPCIIDRNKAVRINTSHEYYSKVYLPNSNSGTTILGLDYLLWALCEAEVSTVNERTQKFFEEMRREVSRILRVLVEDLPEPAEDDTE